MLSIRRDGKILLNLLFIQFSLCCVKWYLKVKCWIQRYFLLNKLLFSITSFNQTNQSLFTLKCHQDLNTYLWFFIWCRGFFDLLSIQICWRNHFKLLAFIHYDGGNLKKGHIFFREAFWKCCSVLRSNNCNSSGELKPISHMPGFSIMCYGDF